MGLGGRVGGGVGGRSVRTHEGVLPSAEGESSGFTLKALHAEGADSCIVSQSGVER